MNMIIDFNVNHLFPKGLAKQPGDTTYYSLKVAEISLLNEVTLESLIYCVYFFFLFPSSLILFSDIASLIYDSL